MGATSDPREEDFPLTDCIGGNIAVKPPLKVKPSLRPCQTAEQAGMHCSKVADQYQHSASLSGSSISLDASGLHKCSFLVSVIKFRVSGIIQSQQAADSERFQAVCCPT